MDDKSMMVLITWIGAIALIVIGAYFQLDFIGMFIFVAIIFALGSTLFVVFGGNEAQDMAEIEHDVSQLRDEVQALHKKIDEIKRLFEE
ncbi:MAG: hypothetical protein ACE5I5_03260 [Candidatus Heimdallarchaeota archaeon]